MPVSYKKMVLADFARHLEKSLDVDHLLLLGAGASRSSGVQTARECIWEWKRDIYLSNNPLRSPSIDCHSTDGQVEIQAWLDGKGGYPPDRDDDEYAFYAEAAFDNNEVRRKYFEDMVADVEPGVGYKILALFADHGVIRIILTTNFDGLAAKAMEQHGLRPREITIETSHFIHRPMRRGERFYIALHGDYKYGTLKNTGEELDSQQDDFKDALRIHLYNKHLIVMGYSGRDKSLMSAIEEAYLKEPKGQGMVFWCSRTGNVSKEVDDLLKRVSASGREARVVVAGDFDEALTNLGRYCLKSVPGMEAKLSGIVKFVGVGDKEVALVEVETHAPTPTHHRSEIDAHIKRLSPAALDAAVKALLIGSWTSDDSDQTAIRDAIDEK